MSARWTPAEYQAYLKRRLSTSKVKNGVSGASDGPDALGAAKTAGRSGKANSVRNSGIFETHGKPVFVQQVQTAEVDGDGQLILPFTLCLPVPPRALWGNGRVHWRAKQNIKESYKRECQEILMLMFRGLKPIKRPLVIDLRYVFTPSHRCPADDDNLIIAFKAGRDALNGVVWCDDRQVRTGRVTQVVEKSPGLLEWLEVTIMENKLGQN